MKFYKENKGITLIELIVAMAIAAIIFTMIMLVVNVSTNSYKRTNDNVKLQMEAQVAMNQISTLAMEAEAVSISSTLTSPNVKYLLQGTTSEYCYAITFIKAVNKLYLVEAASVSEAEAIVPVDKDHLLASNVDSFTMDLTKIKSVSINIDFGLGDSDYSISRKVTLRNAKDE